MVFILPAVKDALLQSTRLKKGGKKNQGLVSGVPVSICGALAVDLYGSFAKPEPKLSFKLHKSLFPLLSSSLLLYLMPLTRRLPRGRARRKACE